MRNSRYYRYLIIVLSALISLATPSVGLRAQDPPTWCLSAWYPSSDDPSGVDSLSQNADQLSVINPFWYSPRADNTLQLNDNAEDATLLTEWRDSGLLIMPSIFAGIPSMLTDDATRTFHIQQIVNLVERMDYDGIDIDYEGFPLNTRNRFSQFIEELAQALHENGRLISIAVHAKTDEKGSWESAEAQDWTRIAPAVDVMTIMTYDYTNRNQPPAPIAPPMWVDDVLKYAESVTDLSKVRMGLNFYGYSWLRGNPPATTTTWVASQRLIDSFKLDVQRDPLDQEARIDLAVKGLPKQTIYFADSTAIEYKLTGILQHYPTLGGIAIWGIGGEDPHNWTILRAFDHGNCPLARS